MTTTPEGRVAAALRQAVIEAGGEIRKLKWEGRNGAPDYFVLFHGNIFLIECKAPRQRPRASQMLEFERLLTNGIMVLVIDQAGDAKTLVRMLTSGATWVPRTEFELRTQAQRHQALERTNIDYCSIEDFFFTRYRKKCD